MAVRLVNRRGIGREITEDLVLQLINDGNDSEIEELVNDDEDILSVPPRVDDATDSEIDKEEDDSQTIEATPSVHARRPLLQGHGVTQRGRCVTRGRRGHNVSRRGGATRNRRCATESASHSLPSESGRRRLWRSIPFDQKQHDYASREIQSIREPLQYYQDYFDNAFYEKAAFCTNKYYLRKTGKILNTNPVELKKFVGMHFIMGCISYPRLHMYWRQEMELRLISKVMSRERFKTLRSAFHVVEEEAAPAENPNSLWKVQPVLDAVKTACNKIERQPGFYSIDEQMIPFSGLCPRGLRQVIKSKPRPTGLKNFVTTTSDGLMIDFEVYKGAKSTFKVDKSIGVGGSVILHLSKSIPPGSCIYFDRYFTSIPLLERLSLLGLHGTGTLMLNRIPNRKDICFTSDRAMRRGDSEQFVSGDTVIVKWMDNKSVLASSNCTSSDNQVDIERWDKKTNSYIKVKQPLIISNYNAHMGGVDVLDQSIEYYRTFMKTRKWTLKVILHFFDLAVANAWRLYKINSDLSRIHRGQILDFLQFKLDVADGLTSTPKRVQKTRAPHLARLRKDINQRIRRPYQNDMMVMNIFQYLTILFNPRKCRMDGCTSRSKIRCEKCDVYLCLTRKSNCFTSFHKI